MRFMFITMKEQEWKLLIDCWSRDLSPEDTAGHFLKILGLEITQAQIATAFKILRDEYVYAQTGRQV